MKAQVPNKWLRVTLDCEAAIFWIFLLYFGIWSAINTTYSLDALMPRWCSALVLVAAIVLGVLNLVWLSVRVSGLLAKVRAKTG